MTDDNAAYDFAERRLGPGRALDTVDLLREAVSYGDIDDSDAGVIAEAIRHCGRHLRRVHPRPLPRIYFR